MRTNMSKFMLSAAVALLGVGAAQAQFDLSWHTIDGGGHMFSTGGNFELGGTIGQPDAGVVMTGGNFELTGGFWVAAAGGAPPCPGDITGDGQVSLADLSVLLATFGLCSGDAGYNAAADIVPNGCIDLSDLSFLLGNFGTIC